ncbi:hypothetical protein MYX77_00955 [Acidobacteriia bacterium AH_259_A11_L15]|nr:hypothetical protein [Acidobacteriia bacterium AH_259_A11_L15]
MATWMKEFDSGQKTYASVLQLMQVTEKHFGSNRSTVRAKEAGSMQRKMQSMEILVLP